MGDEVHGSGLVTHSHRSCKDRLYGKYQHNDSIDRPRDYQWSVFREDWTGENFPEHGSGRDRHAIESEDDIGWTTCREPTGRVSPRYGDRT